MSLKGRAKPSIQRLIRMAEALRTPRALSSTMRSAQCARFRSSSSRLAAARDGSLFGFDFLSSLSAIQSLIIRSVIASPPRRSVCSPQSDERPRFRLSASSFNPTRIACEFRRARTSRKARESPEPSCRKGNATIEPNIAAASHAAPRRAFPQPSPRPSQADRSRGLVKTSAAADRRRAAAARLQSAAAGKEP